MPTGATNLPRRSLDTGVAYHGITMENLVRERLAVGHKPLDTRFYEWIVSIGVFSFGTFILFYDINIARGSILAVAREQLDGVYGVGLSTFFIGSLSLGSLLANGYFRHSRKYGPWLRVISSIYRALLWFSFVQSMARLTPVSQTWISPMVIFFTVISAAEIGVIFIAGRNARSNR